ncbi:MAG: family 20 glycosylhydrolase [Actinomycetes bacterium]
MGSGRGHAAGRRRRPRRNRGRAAVGVVGALALLAGGVGTAVVLGGDAASTDRSHTRVTGADRVTRPPPPPRPDEVPEPQVVPVPADMHSDPDDAFVLTARTRVAVARPAGRDAVRVGEHLARSLRGATGYALPVTRGEPGPGQTLVLSLDDEVPAVGGSDVGGDRADEAYRLDVTRTQVTLRARTAEGLFRATQTLRQLLPPAVERASASGPWAVPGVHVVDGPRFAWRGTMLDVARHFLTVNEVKRYVDAAALYKLNVLHLHLTDDQGWRIAIDGWPRLTRYGGASEVGGGPGGFYTQDEYREIVRYAQRRYVTVVPEIDLPGHTNAALAAYPRLACDGEPRHRYTGTQVGFSSLCTGSATVGRFVRDVLGQVADLTPGAYVHVGGDEAQRTRPDDYARFVDGVQRVVRDRGKTLVGWDEVAGAGVGRGAVVQHWRPFDPGPDRARQAASRGARLVMSPADRVYLDMKYGPGTSLGTDWAGHVSVRDAYAWDPARVVDGVGEDHVLGVEAPVWTETLEDLDAVERMAFPRLPGIAEVAWSPAASRRWDDYRQRLAAQGPRWDALGIAYARTPGVPWPDR